MEKLYKEASRCRPSASSDAYILKIAPCASDIIAALTSADELLLLNAERLDASTAIRVSSTGANLTCMTTDVTGKFVMCGSSDGAISVFDVQSQQKAGIFQTKKHVTALACKGQDVAVGTEQEYQQAELSVWDLRQRKMRWQSTENNDDITALAFHPGRQNVLLSGGDDGLVSLFDTTIPEEDDSLVQAFNHRPVHKAGFVDEGAVYSLSSDQNLVIHPIFDDAREIEPQPIELGDLRPLIPCEYAIDLIHSGNNFILATGSHSKSRVDLVNMKSGVEPDLTSRIVLQGAHGEEIVRSLFVDANSDTIFTAGEDGCVKAWGASSTEGDLVPARPSKGKKSAEERYKPY